MGSVVEDRRAECLETVVVRSPPALRAGISIKKLLIVPVTFAAVFALIDGPNQDGLAKGGIYGALIGGSGLAGAIVCAKRWRELVGILIGVAVGTFFGMPVTLASVMNRKHLGWNSTQVMMGLLFGAVIGWLAMRLFRPRRPTGISALDHSSESTDLH